MDRRRDRNIGTPARKSSPSAAAVRFGALTAGMLALAGCSGLGLGQSDKASDGLAFACPKVAIVRDLSQVTQFRPGGGQDLTDIMTRAALIDFRGNCDYTSDGVTVNINLLLGAERGPAMRGDQATYRYFVAIDKPGEDEPVAKSEFETTVTFAADKKQVGSREELAPKIPLPKNANAKDWKIFIGFQLTPEQLTYNRDMLKK